ncbi:MAG TPA: hypothetical protein VGK84_10095, partial [Candidatus Tumulicola sp.]
AEKPSYYEGLQYYVGNEAFSQPELFEHRLKELWNPSERVVPFYTEQKNEISPNARRRFS